MDINCKGQMMLLNVNHNILIKLKYEGAQNI